MSPPTHWVTPRLLMGAAPPGITCLPCTDIDTAVAAMQAGRVALLPSESWAMAEEVLTALGLSADTIADRLHFARTARTLHRL
jgi:hypothetical protein